MGKLTVLKFVEEIFYVNKIFTIPKTILLEEFYFTINRKKIIYPLQKDKKNLNL